MSIQRSILLGLVVTMVVASASCTNDTKSNPGALDGDSGLLTPASDAGTKGSAEATPVDVVDAADAAIATDAAAPDAADAAVTFTTTPPFATGLGVNSVALADGLIDPHWTVKDGAANVLTAFVQTDALGYVGYWMAPSTTSKFISPFVDTVDPSGNGTFTYSTTFTLRTGVNLGAVSLAIRCASDNQMMSVSVNGTAVAGVTVGGYSTFQTLNVTSPFAVGTNTVEFVVSNTGGPTGLRAELDLTAN